MKTEIIPPFFNKMVFLLVADAFFEVVTGDGVFPVFYLLYQCVQNAFFVSGADELHVFVQSAGPAFSPCFDALGWREWSSKGLQAFELLENIQEQVCFYIFFQISGEEFV